MAFKIQGQRLCCICGKPVEPIYKQDTLRVKHVNQKRASFCHVTCRVFLPYDEVGFIEGPIKGEYFELIAHGTLMGEDEDNSRLTA